jgi:tetratricopeptide (TPR) repeat protein
VKLLALQAEVAVHAGLAVLAPKALDAFERAAGIEDPWMKGISHGLKVRATLLRSAWLRRTGALSEARALLEPYLEPTDVKAPNAGVAALVRSSRGPRSRGPAAQGSRFGLTRAVRRAHIDLELGEADLALGRCQEALAHGKKALERARKERHAVVAFAAEGLLADAWTRVGEPDKQLARLDRVVHAPPHQALPQIVVEVKLRWLVARLAAIELGQVEVGETVSEEANAIATDADLVAREAARMKDLAATARAAFIAAQAALRARRPVEALRQAEWVRELVKREPVGGPPQHAVEWLLASVHYQMKWFKSANALSQRAMESLRTVAQSSFGSDDRDRWLRAGSNSLIGLLR